MELNAEMKNSLLLAMEDSTLDFMETFEQAIWLHLESTGRPPAEICDEDEFMALFKECQKFLIDEVIIGLMLKEVVEVKGIKDDEFVYGLTDNVEQEKS